MKSTGLFTHLKLGSCLNGAELDAQRGRSENKVSLSLHGNVLGYISVTPTYVSRLGATHRKISPEISCSDYESHLFLYNISFPHFCWASNEENRFPVSFIKNNPKPSTATKNKIVLIKQKNHSNNNLIHT